MRSKKLQILLASLGLLLFSNVQAGSLHEAVYDRDFESVKSLLKKGAVIDQVGLYRDGSALHLAARSGQQEIAQLLLENGAIVDVRNHNDLTPLHNAAWNGNIEMMQLLLNAGADINATNYENHTPLSCAQDNNQTEAIRFIESRLQTASN